MLSIFTLVVKLIDTGNSLQNLTIEANNSFLGSNDDRCPACGRRNLKEHKPYKRPVTDLVHGKVDYIFIETKRYKCECGKTHVLLPILIIPYSRHSLPFMIWVLYFYFTKADTVESICNKFGISIPTLYRWKEKFLRDKEVWLKRLRNAETSAKKFLEDLEFETNIGEKLRSFAREVYPHRQFLQTHKYAYLHQHL